MTSAAREQSGTSRREFYLTVQGQRLWASLQGEGQGHALPLLMGFGGNLELWRPFRRALGTYETIAFDLPGMGKSAVSARVMRAPAVASMILALLDRLGYQTVDVLGVSMGGGLAQQLAHQAPERVRRLILCSTTVGTVVVPGDPRELLRLLRPSGAMRSIESAASAALDDDLVRDPHMKADLAAMMLKLPGLRTQLAQLYAVSGWTSLPWIRGLHQPTLVMHGDHDRLLPLANGRLLNALIPHSTLHVVKGGGHLFLGFQAEEAARVTRGFLAGA